MRKSLWENMVRCRGHIRACGRNVYRCHDVYAVTDRAFGGRLYIQGGAEQIRVDGGAGHVGVDFAFFHRPLLFGAFNLLHVGDAGVFLGGRARLYEIGNRYGGKQADDGDDDHDFNQGEA